MYYNDLRNFRSFAEVNGNIYLYYFLNFAMTFLRFSLLNTNFLTAWEAYTVLSFVLWSIL